MNRKQISLVERLGRPRLGVVGDLMLDEYVWGEVERVSPEAPIPVLRVQRRHHRAGGAGSVVVNLARLGAEVVPLSVLGRDPAGEEVAGILRGEGCDLSGLLFDESRRTTVKSRHLGFVQHADRAVQQILRVDEEDLKPTGEDLVERLLAALRERIGDLDAILVSDYAKGLVGGKLVRGIVELAGDKPVLVDPALVADYSVYRGVSLICPNRYEAEHAAGIPCRDVEGARRAGERLVETLALGAAAVTLDREGIYLCEAGGTSRHFPTRARSVVDVTGAGDMVLTVLGIVVAAGRSLEDAVRLANVAAGIEVRQVGVTPLSRADLIQELTYEGDPAATKIKNAPDLALALGAARDAGKTVVFTNGCFDLLHLGHHRLLHGARREGDVLVVAINSDASVRRLKGPSRPRISEDDRVRMLAGLEVVDYVTVFDDDTPNRLLEELRPDVLVKGSEYREGVVVGREIVEGYGGRIAFVEQVPGFSTSALLGEEAGPRK